MDTPRLVTTGVFRMNEKEINEAFDREYEQYKNSPEHKHEFVKIKKPTYYIAKHSDEDLRAAVLKEREACAKLCEESYSRQIIHYPKGYYVDPNRLGKYSKEIASRCAAAIRGRTE